jgi:hypothetical protein
MSKKNGKRKGTAKRKRTTPAKQKGAIPAKQEHVTPSHKAALEGRTRHWTQWIKPKGAAMLSQMLGPIDFVIKNWGSNNVFLMAQNGDLMDIVPGATRATYAVGTITVENRGETWALIEFDFLPIYKK